MEPQKIFYYAKTLDWTKELDIRNQTIEQYIKTLDSNNTTSLLCTDGQALGWWLSGSHPEKSWVLSKNTCNTHEFLNDAEINLEYIYFCGIFEYFEESVYQMLRLNNITCKEIPCLNKTPRYSNITNNLREQIEQFLPHDMYLYNKAKMKYMKD